MPEVEGSNIEKEWSKGTKFQGKGVQVYRVSEIRRRSSEHMNLVASSLIRWDRKPFDCLVLVSLDK